MTEKFVKMFGATRVVLPVIHVRSWDETLRNVVLARECGADGVWLISHDDVAQRTVVDWQRRLISELGWTKIGVNLLGVRLEQAFPLVGDTGMGLWADNAGVVDGDHQVAERVDGLRSHLGDGLYFGGVAFKYQVGVRDLALTTASAQKYVDVITTSGAATGEAAPLHKLITMRNAAPDTPIAIASGITPENVVDFLPYVNAFMVATGISTDDNGDGFYNIDRDKLRRLIDRVRIF